MAPIGVKLCLLCNKSFPVYGMHKDCVLYCSDECTFLNNFIPGYPFQCWLWTGRKDKKGYGVFSDIKFGHRYSYEYYNGPRTKGLVVRHLCNNPGCVNPSHLKEGTYKENANDRLLPGGKPYIGLKGSENGVAKLTDDIVKAIFTSKEDYKILAIRYNISKPRVRDILSGRGWNHITGLPKFVPTRTYKKRGT